MWEYQIITVFTKCYNSNWSEEDFVVTKLKNTEQWKYVNRRPLWWRNSWDDLWKGITIDKSKKV